MMGGGLDVTSTLLLELNCRVRNNFPLTIDFQNYFRISIILELRAKFHKNEI